MFYKTILFDFDGVLCHDPFFGSLKESHPKVYEFIQNRIFYKGSDIPDKWMRAQITSSDICRYISKNTDIDIGYLSNALIEDTKKMRIEKRLLGFAKNLIKNNKKIALVTDNMDIFDTIAKNHELDKIFPVIVNSFDYGFTKKDFNGKLFDITLEKLGAGSYSEALLIDNSIRIKPVFENKGGAAFLYETYEKFEPWAKENFSISAC